MTEPDPGAAKEAERLHRAALRLLRALRRSDETATGLTAPRASALSVLVFAGPQSLKDLAAAEQVRAPTMSRLIAAMADEGLVKKEGAEADARAVVISATAKGRALLMKGRAARVRMLAHALAQLPQRERQALAAGTDIILKVNGNLTAAAD